MVAISGTALLIGGLLLTIFLGISAVIIKPLSILAGVAVFLAGIRFLPEFLNPVFDMAGVDSRVSLLAVATVSAIAGYVTFKVFGWLLLQLGLLATLVIGVVVVFGSAALLFQGIGIILGEVAGG